MGGVLGGLLAGVSAPVVVIDGVVSESIVVLFALVVASEDLFELPFSGVVGVLGWLFESSFRLLLDPFLEPRRTPKASAIGAKIPDAPGIAAIIEADEGQWDRLDVCIGGESADPS